jgi:hypothetical protein
MCKRAYFPSYFLLLLSFFLAAGCQNQSSEDNPLQQQVEQQIEQSMQAGLSYEKQVQDLNTSAPSSEDSLYQLTHSSGEGEQQADAPLKQDLVYALGPYYSDPYLLEQFELSYAGDTLVARLREDWVGSDGLQFQKLLWQQPDSVIRYLETSKMQRSWLYETDVHLRVSFGEKGLYHSHQLELTSGVPLLSHRLAARMSGKMNYAP